MKFKIIFVFTIFIFGLSCSAPKDVVYFQDIDRLSPEQLEIMEQTYSTRVVPDDLLTITVSSWDYTVVTPFNPPPFSFSYPGETTAERSSQLRTYLVDKDGLINFPILGKIHVQGLTIQELNEKLEKQISTYVPDAVVNSQIINFRITVLGEVVRPGTISVGNNRLSIIDAIGRAGDLTINAKRDNILVIRDNAGKKETARLDITRPDIFASPYYYLQQNDVVYVEPNKAKKKNANYSQAQQYNITVFSSIMSALSVLTTMVTLIVRK